MSYSVERTESGWWAISGDRCSSSGPFRTEREAQEVAEERTLLDEKLPRPRKEPEPDAAVVLFAAVVGVAVTGAAIGLVGAVAYYVFRWVTGV